MFELLWLLFARNSFRGSWYISINTLMMAFFSRRKFTFYANHWWKPLSFIIRLSSPQKVCINRTDFWADSHPKYSAKFMTSSLFEGGWDEKKKCVNYMRFYCRTKKTQFPIHFPARVMHFLRKFDFPPAFLKDIGFFRPSHSQSVVCQAAKRWSWTKI